MPAVIYPLATDVMLLDSYTSEPSHSALCVANKRRSSVTFEDQVDQIPKGIYHGVILRLTNAKMSLSCHQ